MVLLVTSDGDQFVVDKEIAGRSVVIRNVLEDTGEADQPIPISNVSSSVMKKVIEYCEHHRGDMPQAERDWRDGGGLNRRDISEWDSQFIAVDQEMLLGIVLAANYLDIKPLLDLGSMRVASMLKGKSPEEIRKAFNITNDFTPE